jgi:hypothetical protein
MAIPAPDVNKTPMVLQNYYRVQAIGHHPDTLMQNPQKRRLHQRNDRTDVDPLGLADSNLQHPEDLLASEVLERAGAMPSPCW